MDSSWVPRALAEGQAWEEVNEFHFRTSAVEAEWDIQVEKVKSRWERRSGA